MYISTSSKNTASLHRYVDVATQFLTSTIDIGRKIESTKKMKQNNEISL